MCKPCRSWHYLTAACLAVCLSSAGIAAEREINEQIDFSGSHSQVVELIAGQTLEISASIASPSKLPANGRLAVEWIGPAADIGFRKVLHALDPDVYLVYWAPQEGRYTLSLSAVADEEPPASAARWRETGVLADLKSFPKQTPWPAGHQVEVRLLVRPVDFGEGTHGIVVETEPNNSIAQAPT